MLHRIALVGFALLVLLVTQVHAEVRKLDQSDIKDATICTPQPACMIYQDLGFATVASTGGFGTFSHKTGLSPSFRMGLGLGADGEIGQVFNVAGKEVITVTYAIPATIQEITLGFLHCAACGFGDIVDETALVVADGVVYRLTANKTNAATWSGPGIAVGLNPPDDGFFRIIFPFPAGVAVTKLEFLAQRDVVNSAAGSDFSIVSIVDKPTSPSVGGIGGTWTELGPRPFLGLNPCFFRPDLCGAGVNLEKYEAMSGQVSAIAVDTVHDPSGNLVYVGSSSGGLWMSTNGLDATPHFVLLSDQTQSLSVGSIALDTRTNPPVIYVGTGAPDNSANISSYTGTGILKSSDGGMSWRRVESADSGMHPFTGQGFSSILVDPVNPDILIASTGFGTDPNYPHGSVPQGDPAFQHLGIYRSLNAGESWTQVLSADYDGADFGASLLTPGAFFHIDVVYEPKRRVYFAGISKKGLYVSKDGSTWDLLPNAGSVLPNKDQTHRVSLATRDGVLWALILKVPFANSDAFQLFQSSDGGGSWSAQPLLNLPFKGSLMYVAAPPNAKSLLVASELLYRRDDVGNPNSSWRRIENNIHGDQHAIAFAGPETWYVGDDGGAWATKNGGDTWSSLNAELRTMEFFSAAANSADSGSYAGGTQDNGSVFTAGSPDWKQIVFGDGMYAAADPQDSGAFFTSDRGNISYVPVSNPDLRKNVIFLGDFTKDTVPANLLHCGATNDPRICRDFMTPYELLPADPRFFSGVAGFPDFQFRSSRILIVGADNPWLVAFDPGAVSKTPGSACSSITGSVCVPLTNGINSVIHYIAPFPGDPTTAYLTAGSALYRLNNISFAGSAAATLITRTPGRDDPLNGDVLGHLAVSPSGTLYLIKVGFLDGQKIFKMEPGKEWVNISGNLPNTPVNWITVDPVDPNFLFLSTNTGVYVATDGGVAGEQWRRLGSGLPNVPVVQTQISSSRKLIAATYGRGVWTLDISALEKPTVLGKITLWSGVTLGLGETALLPVQLSIPAPSTGLTVTLTSSDRLRVDVTPSVVIAGNQISPNVQPQVKAVNLGSANITASAPGFTGDTQAVQVTGSIKFEVGRVTIFAGDTKNIALILSGPAPPGLTVTLTSDSDAAKVPATLTFAPNATSVNVPVLGFARGSATIHASAAPNLADTTIMVTVP